MGRENEDSTISVPGVSPQGIQNIVYSDAESDRIPNPPEYNQIAQIPILPGQVQMQAGQPQFMTQQQYMIPSGQIIQPGVISSNAVPQVIYVQPNTHGLLPTPVQQGQQIVYIQNPDINRVPTIFDCESPGYFTWFLIGFCCPPIATFLTSRKLNEGCSAVRHILPFLTLILGCAGEYHINVYFQVNENFKVYLERYCTLLGIVMMAKTIFVLLVY